MRHSWTFWFRQKNAKGKELTVKDVLSGQIYHSYVALDSALNMMKVNDMFGYSSHYNRNRWAHYPMLLDKAETIEDKELRRPSGCLMTGTTHTEPQPDENYAASARNAIEKSPCQDHEEMSGRRSRRNEKPLWQVA
jgi:hypothetical protein